MQKNEAYIHVASRPEELEIHKFHHALPGFIGYIQFNHQPLPVSRLKLHQHGAHIIPLICLPIVNFLSRLVRIRFGGNACCPGYLNVEADTDAGFNQWQNGTLKSCGILVVNIQNPKTEYADALIFEAEPMMVLDIPQSWKTFEDYSNAMSSKYRVRLKKVFENAQDVKCVFSNGPELTQQEKQICVQLLKETLSEKTIALPKDLNVIFDAFIQFYKDKFIIQKYYYQNNLIGFMSFVQKPSGTLFAMHVGFSPQHGKQFSLYQKMLYDAINVAFDKNLHQINYGRTATEIKSTIGAKPVRNAFLVYVRNPLIRWMGECFARYLYKKPEYLIRNPFKTSA